MLCISRSQKAGEYVNEVKSRIMNQAEMARDEEAGTSSGHKHTEGATIPAKKVRLSDSINVLILMFPKISNFSVH